MFSFFFRFVIFFSPKEKKEMNLTVHQNEQKAEKRTREGRERNLKKKQRRDLIPFVYSLFLFLFPIFLSLIFPSKVVKITGVPNASKIVTIFVRGVNTQMVDEADRSIHDALCVVRSLVKEK